MENSKLRAKIGVHEFEAEGPAEQITEQYNAWKEMVSTFAAAAAAPAVQRPLDANQGKPNFPANVVTEVRTREGFAAPWDIFGDDHDRELMTLRVHPPAGETRDADAILLVMYGYRKAGADGNGVSEVPVTKLKESLDVSGIRIPRIDRAAAPYIRSGYLLKAGRGKGGIYRLTNTGYARAEELAQRLFSQLV